MYNFSLHAATDGLLSQGSNTRKSISLKGPGCASATIPLIGHLSRLFPCNVFYVMNVVSCYSHRTITGYWIGPDIDDDGWGFVEASIHPVT
ncbi:unnamed protein product [Linum tenue]|uniref:Uncharacterized protein n=1 Tax=Linum tenue TaxID=586396 RepID=A0AAV0NMZ7_9ROSI|nr:unnamed protein product [Linum tenue]